MILLLILVLLLCTAFIYYGLNEIRQAIMYKNTFMEDYSSTEQYYLDLSKATDKRKQSKVKANTKPSRKLAGKK